MTYIGGDFTGSSTTSTSETEIGEVQIAANSARNTLIILAGIAVEGIGANTGDIRYADFKIRTGTSTTATSNTQRGNTVRLSHGGTDGTNNANFGDAGGFMSARITSSDETFSGIIYVNVTAQLENVAGAGSAICKSLMVFGI